MKKLLFILGILISFSAYSQLSEKESKALDALIASKVELEADVIKSSVLGTLFESKFYKLKRTPHYKANGGFSETILCKTNGEMLEVTNAEMLVPQLKKDFLLKNETEAKKLKEALRLLIPDGGMGSEDEIVQQDLKWILVCEEWFGDKKGFVVNTAEDGAVLKIEYSSKLEI